jgi:hypothetical protein
LSIFKILIVGEEASCHAVAQRKGVRTGMNKKKIPGSSPLPGGKKVLTK